MYSSNTTSTGRAMAIAAAVSLAAFAACGKGDKDKDKTPPAGKGKAPAGAKATSVAPGMPAKVRVTGIPDENPTKLQRAYAPLVSYLESKLGTKVEYVPVTDYGAAVQALVGGTVDFAWLGGFTHVQARTKTEVEPLAMRDIDREFKSVFIAHADSGVATPADLKGKTFAFGSKSSTSGHLMPRHFLLDIHKLDPDKDFKGKPVFSNAHDATAKMVESGRVQAGALNAQVWQRMVKDKQVDASKVKVIWTTPGYVDYVWTARTALPQVVRSKFRLAMLGLSAEDPAHKKILDHAGAGRYVPAAPKDFDAIESVAKTTGLLK